MDSYLKDNRFKSASKQNNETEERKLESILISSILRLHNEQAHTATPSSIIVELTLWSGKVKYFLVNGLSFLSPSLTGLVLFGILNGLFLMNVSNNSDGMPKSYLTKISELESRTIENERELTVLKRRLEVLEYEIFEFESQNNNKQNQRSIHTQKHQGQEEDLVKIQRHEFTRKGEIDGIEFSNNQEKAIPDLKTAVKRKDQELEKLKGELLIFKSQLQFSKLELAMIIREDHLLINEYKKTVETLSADLLEMSTAMFEAYNLYLREQGDTDLHIYAVSKDMKKMQKLLETNPELDVNIRNQKLMTPLHRAVEGGNLTRSLPVIKYLIQNGVDVFLKDDQNYTFLHTLLDNLVNHSATYLAECHELAHILIARNLTPLFNIPGGDHGRTPFHLAILRLELEERTLDLLHKNGVHFDALDNFGNHAFLFAVVGRRSINFMSNLLLKLDANFTWSLVNYKNRSLLYIAAEFCNVEALRFFLARGGSEVDINGVDDIGNTPLHIAVWGKEDVIETVLFLIQNGANVNILNNEGCSPLDYAISRDDWDDKYDVIELLQNIQ